MRDIQRAVFGGILGDAGAVDGEGRAGDEAEVVGADQCAGGVVVAEDINFLEGDAAGEVFEQGWVEGGVPECEVEGGEGDFASAGTGGAEGEDLVGTEVELIDGEEAVAGNGEVGAACARVGQEPDIGIDGAGLDVGQAGCWRQRWGRHRGCACSPGGGEAGGVRDRVPGRRRRGGEGAVGLTIIVLQFQGAELGGILHHAGAVDAECGAADEAEAVITDQFAVSPAVAEQIDFAEQGSGGELLE